MGEKEDVSFEDVEELAVEKTIKLKPASEARCMKCEEMVEIENPEVFEMANGGHGTRGDCPNCGSKVVTVEHETESIEE